MRIMKFSVNYTADLTRIEIRIIFEPLTIAIFRLCLLPKMRLSVNLEGRCTAYKNDIIGKYNYILGNTTFSIWMLIKESFDKFLGFFQFSTTVSQISCNRLDSLVSLFFKAPLTQVVVVGNLYFALGRPDRWTNHVGPRTHTLCMAVGTRGRSSLHILVDLLSQ